MELHEEKYELHELHMKLHEKYEAELSLNMKLRSASYDARESMFPKCTTIPPYFGL